MSKRSSTGRGNFQAIEGASQGQLGPLDINIFFGSFPAQAFAGPVGSGLGPLDVNIFSHLAYVSQHHYLIISHFAHPTDYCEVPPAAGQRNHYLAYL